MLERVRRIENEVTVAAAQFDVKIFDKQYNFEKMASMVSRADLER